MKKLIFLFLALCILLPSIYAFDANLGYEWLINQSNNGSFNNNIVDVSTAFLALDTAGVYSETEKIASYLKTQENIQHCWPKRSCMVKDTSFALLALNKHGEDTSEIEEWLTKAQTSSALGGNWWLQVATSDNGTCRVSYDKDDKAVEKDIYVNNGYFPNCGNKTFLDLNTCLEPNLVNNYVSLKLDVDCSDLSNAVISLIYNSATSYYIIDEAHNTQAELIVKNGCYGQTYQASCDYESSLYASWILNEIQSNVDTSLYLILNYDEKNILHNSLLYLIKYDDSYLDELVKSQRKDGSFDSDVYKTSLAILALRASQYQEAVENATIWLENKQKDDGSWGTILNTAMALYAAFPMTITTAYCGDGYCDINENSISCPEDCEEMPSVCNFDDFCDCDQGEDYDNCPSDCEPGQCEEDLCSNNKLDIENNEEGIDCGGECPITCGEKYGDCYVDGVCQYGDPYWENMNNCPEDCSCGDGLCDDYEDYYNECPDDCGSKAAEECNYDGFCDFGEACSCTDCEDEPECQAVEEAVCNYDGICGLDEDCSCSDCFDDERCKEEKKGFPWWIIILIIIIVVFGYYFYTKYYKRKKKPKPGPFDSFRLSGAKPPLFKPPFGKPPAEKPPGFFTGRKPPLGGIKGPSKVEEELEKSLKEAKKLIKGK